MLTKIFTIIFTITVLLGTAQVVGAQQPSAPPPPQEENIEAVITTIKEEKQIEVNGKKQIYQKLELTVTSEKQKDKKIVIENGKIATANVQKYNLGDKVALTISKDFQGKELYTINDYVRRAPLAWLFVLFVGLTILIGRKRGLASLVGMAISLLVIIFFILPQILAGFDPVIIVITASLVIIPITFYLSHGFNRKTTAAVIGTIIGLIITGILASMFVEMTKLTGFASEEAGFLESLKQGTVNIRDLLLAGIIIGALGVLDDITVSQSAIVYQLHHTSPRLTFGELYGKAIDIGRDHIASMVNTLVLVYTGAALPLLLLFINNPHPFAEVINYEIVAEEIVRTLVASIGLIIAVPITTLLACAFAKEII